MPAWGWLKSLAALLSGGRCSPSQGSIMIQLLVTISRGRDPSIIELWLSDYAEGCCAIPRAARIFSHSAISLIWLSFDFAIPGGLLCHPMGS